jgi:hypothetical protein
MTLEAAMDGAAREFAINAASHHLDDVVERQLHRRSQFTNQRLSIAGKLLCYVLGVCERSPTVVRLASGGS